MVEAQACDEGVNVFVVMPTDDGPSTQPAVRAARPYLELTRTIAHRVALTGPVGAWVFNEFPPRWRRGRHHYCSHLRSFIPSHLPRSSGVIFSME